MCVCIYCLKRISSPKKKNLSSYTYPHVAWNPYDFSFFLSPVELRRFKIDSRRAGCLKTCDKRRFGKPVNHFSYLKRLFGPYLWLAFKVNSPKNETTSDIVYSSLCHYTFLVCKIATKILQDLLSFTKIFNTDLVKPKAWIFLTEHILCIQFCVMDGCVKVTFLSFRHSGISYHTPLRLSLPNTPDPPPFGVLGRASVLAGTGPRRRISRLLDTGSGITVFTAPSGSG